MSKYRSDVAIIGGGPAGLTAAIYALRAGLSAVIYDGNALGGQMLLAHEIENYAGFTSISGMELADSMAAQATALGTETVYSAVTSVKVDSDGFFVAAGETNNRHRAVIIAAGTNRRNLGVPGEEEFIGRGVSYCAVCDGRFFKDKDVAVVGGGNTAVGDALYLAKFCKSVTVIHRREAFRADRILVDRLSALENVHLLMNARMEKINGDMRVTSLDIQKTGEYTLPAMMQLPVDGVFVAVGSAPQISFLDGISNLAYDDSGYLLTDERCRTVIPGLFAAGDVRAKSLRQIATAVADGAIAAVEAAEFIEMQKHHGGVSV